MWLNEMWQRWLGRSPRQSRRRATRQRPRFRPCLEVLEDRTLLSAYTASTAGELIADIAAANSIPVGNTNTITLLGNIQLSGSNNSTNGANGLPVITAGDDLTILGGGYSIERLTTATTPAFRLFDVESGASLTLEDVTLQGGLAQGTSAVPNSADGGAIYNSGTLTLTGVTLQGNEAQGSNGAAGNAITLSGSAGANAFGGGLY
ncbi:MAG: hypothetical protein ACRELF_20370, partial [Gemmataceae bacterium]